MKFIYLDEWCWINLKEAHFNENSCYHNFLHIAKTRVLKEEWAFPLSIWHLNETQNTGNDLSRNQLASIQRMLSDRWTINSFPFIKDDEIHYALKKELLPQNKVILQELPNLFGKTRKCYIDEALVQKAANLVKEDKERFFSVFAFLSEHFHTYSHIAADFSDLTSLKEQHLLHLNSLRKMHDIKKLDEYEMLLRVLKDFFTDKQQLLILSDLYPNIQYLKKNAARCKIVEYFKSFPCFYTGVILEHQLIKSKCSFDKNDLIDLLHLSSAIPYCDIVVTEKQWTQYAKQGKIDDLYSTILLSDINDLMSMRE